MHLAGILRGGGVFLVALIDSRLFARSGPVRTAQTHATTFALIAPIPPRTTAILCSSWAPRLVIY